MLSEVTISRDCWLAEKNYYSGNALEKNNSCINWTVLFTAEQKEEKIKKQKKKKKIRTT